MTPSTRSSKAIGALIGAVAALSIGGIGFAFAQEAEVPTTEAPAVQAPADATPATPDGKKCDHDGSTPATGADTSSDTTPSASQL